MLVLCSCRRLQVVWAAVALSAKEVDSLKAEEHAFYYSPFDGTHYACPGLNRCCEITFCCGTRTFI